VRPSSKDALLPAIVGFLLGVTLPRPPAIEAPERLPAGFARPLERDPDKLCFRDLQRLPSIGPSRALAVVEARHRSGLSGGPEAWDAIRGIGHETVRAVREFLAERSPRARSP
jgi:hypothetical protein